MFDTVPLMIPEVNGSSRAARGAGADARLEGAHRHESQLRDHCHRQRRRAAAAVR
jgi:hypothetical protein